ncbi:serine/threonine protein kinase [Nakamurella silvestris]|nr:serine/threonine protein kinase [Nakamurella silvestris]
MVRRPRGVQGRTVVQQGRSGRQAVEEIAAPADRGTDAALSSYEVATHGPEPVPDWVITTGSAVDTPLGILKTGKEADVHLLDRSVPGGPGCLLAVKTYRSAEHRLFHRDAGYLEGRRVRRSREMRAMANRTAFGRDLISGQWAGAEFQMLSRLWQAGASVPYPVQLIGTELMMEFIGSPDGVAAPRLASWTPPAGDELGGYAALWDDLEETLILLASFGLTHGDLSPYNVLVAGDRCVLIDLPQAVDVIANPGAREYLSRDCRVIAEFFRRKGVHSADGELLELRLLAEAGLQG